MIDLYYWPTPCGWKITIMLEELELPYRLIPVNLRKGEQHSAAFGEVNPNRKMPALVDHDSYGTTTIFESGAILVYLAEKTGRLLPAHGPARYEVMSWLMWQMGGLGPINAQTKHFRDFAPGKGGAYATERFITETHRLYRVMNMQLERNAYLAGEYSIADIACWPFILPYERQFESLEEYPSLAQWAERMLRRPAVRRGLDVGREYRIGGPLDTHVKHLLSPNGARDDQPHAR
jgi:GSH-dependent disulfide-bond oxidoreductase